MLLSPHCDPGYKSVRPQVSHIETPTPSARRPRRPRSRSQVVTAITRGPSLERTTHVHARTATSYFIVDAHIALWDARPENQRNIHGKQFIDCFYDYHRNLSPESEVWSYEDYLYQGGERLMKDLFDDGYVDHAIFQPALPRRVLLQGLRADRRGVRARHQAPPDKLTYNHHFDPRNGEVGLDQLRLDAEKFDLKGRQALHRRVARRIPRLASSTTRGRTGTSRPAANWASRTSTSTRARPSGRWTATPSTSPTSTTWRPTSPT